MIKEIKNNLKEQLEKYYKDNFNLAVEFVVEEPKKAELGDISIPVFALIKPLGKKLPEITAEVCEVIKGFDLPVENISAVGGFVNMFISREKIAKIVLAKCIEDGLDYGKSNVGEGKNITLDYSSPNIAKSFSIGHLRSTMIGNSLKKIYDKCGYSTYGINYLGDWGTQFGKMIVAYKTWEDKEKILADPINELTALYVKFHKEAVDHPELEDKAREAFRKMELRDPEYLELWEKIRELSLKESEQIYKILEVKFDSYRGEAFYNDKMDSVVEELESKGLLVEDNGAQIVKLGDDMPPALIKRSDGGSLYITRDIAAVLYRKKMLNFSKILYVVGNEQKLHFEQLKSVVKKMGYDFADDIIHVNFGLYLTNGKKASTREGNVVKLYDVIKYANSLALNQINEKNPNLKNKEEIAEKVAVGAIIFNDLKNFRGLDVEFDLEKSIKFEGQTGPYLQYTGVRINSILKDKTFDNKNIDLSLFTKNHYFELVRLIDDFENVIIEAAEEYSPSVIARYLLNLATAFNKLYSLEKMNIDDEVIRNTNFTLLAATKNVLEEGLRLLGIKYLEEM